MKTLSILSFLTLALTVDGRSWQPKSPLHHGVMMKDFVNSRALPITSPQGAPGGSTSSSSKLSDDVARGGHASVKTTPELEEKKIAAKDTADDASSTLQETEGADSIKSINMNVTVDKMTKRQKKKLTSAAKIAKKLKVRERQKMTF